MCCLVVAILPAFSCPRVSLAEELASSNDCSPTASVNLLPVEERMKMSPEQLDRYYQGILKEASAGPREPESSPAKAESPTDKYALTPAEQERMEAYERNGRPESPHAWRRPHGRIRAATNTTGNILRFTARAAGAACVIGGAALGAAAQGAANARAYQSTYQPSYQPVYQPSYPMTDYTPHFTNFSVMGPGMQYHTGTITQMGNSINITEF